MVQKFSEWFAEQGIEPTPGEHIDTYVSKVLDAVGRHMDEIVSAPPVSDLKVTELCSFGGHVFAITDRGLYRVRFDSGGPVLIPVKPEKETWDGRNRRRS